MYQMLSKDLKNANWNFSHVHILNNIVQWMQSSELCWMLFFYKIICLEQNIDWDDCV